MAAPVTTNDAWLEALRSPGPDRDDAIERLHELLLRAARHEVARRGAALSYVRGEELDDVATQAADDALVAVLSKLDDFRGASRFTTWAYKFAVLEAGVRVRRRAWQDREVVLDGDAWARLDAARGGPARDAEQAELIAAIADAIAQDLTPRQREVLVALAIDGVPIDVLAERLGTNRNALYKTLHDARRRLRTELESRGHRLEEG
ncbi:MAG TPA: sigma-70 family RNA polymerase sigma factor [Thermoleophilaceae bacterium]|jgi:RNA polymerase sigma-70 factor (ECF subfamily)